MAPKTPMAPKTKSKDPCGKCDDACGAQSAVHCHLCESWFHLKCVEGMTPEFLENCKLVYEIFNASAFLCKTCRKIIGKFNKQMKDLQEQVAVLGNRITVLELEKEATTQRLAKTEMITDRVKTGLEEVEKEVENGMAKAKEEVKEDVRNEMKEREERSANIVVYGLAESKEEDAEKRKEEEKIKLEELARQLEVEVKGEMIMKFRAGKKPEGEEKPRPLIVKFTDEETRERIMSNARKLSRKDGWKTVFISPDQTWQQREEGKKVEAKLKAEAAQKTEEAKKEGRTGRFIVVGQRGRRRLTWTRE
jgi:hypothetical protein